MSIFENGITRDGSDEQIQFNWKNKTILMRRGLMGSFLMSRPENEEQFDQFQWDDDLKKYILYKQGYVILPEQK